MAVTSPRFTDRTLAFLRAIRRHNDREWFRARRDRYDKDVREPMVALVERLAEDFRLFAPELIAAPRTSIYRIYRDTRFSADKRPLKTHIAALFPRRGLPKHEGAGLYVEISPDYVFIAGGLYAPRTPDLQRVREHLASNFTPFRAIVESPAFRRRIGTVGGDALQRMPRGFPADHPAGQYLRLRQFLAGGEHPSRLAVSPRFYAVVLATFRLLVPLIRFLNEPLTHDRPLTITHRAPGSS
jgi:uncharacterized protein (TIGR02453 family)